MQDYCVEKGNCVLLEAYLTEKAIFGKVVFSHD